ncbi:hypothetical protein M0802_004743 [Mischocyttarus mexicanus]|nr:hypothetical protein M0802_004743 [Mischocyttarus mexicanus]
MTEKFEWVPGTNIVNVTLTLREAGLLVIFQQFVEQQQQQQLQLQLQLQQQQQVEEQTPSRRFLLPGG